MCVYMPAAHPRENEKARDLVTEVKCRLCAESQAHTYVVAVTLEIDRDE